MASKKSKSAGETAEREQPATTRTGNPEKQNTILHQRTLATRLPGEGHGPQPDAIADSGAETLSASSPETAETANTARTAGKRARSEPARTPTTETPPVTGGPNDPVFGPANAVANKDPFKDAGLLDVKGKGYDERRAKRHEKAAGLSIEEVQKLLPPGSTITVRSATETTISAPMVAGHAALRFFSGATLAEAVGEMASELAEGRRMLVSPRELTGATRDDSANNEPDAGAASADASGEPATSAARTPSDARAKRPRGTKGTSKKSGSRKR
jgi:hypothetical protein